MWLILFRHGIAVAREEPACPPDPERPLTGKGQARTRAAAEGLHTIGVVPSAIWSSPYLRARQTAAIAADVLGFPPERIRTTEALLPGADPAALFAELASRTDGDAAATVLCAGHAPHLDLALSLAVGGAAAPLTRLKKAGAVCVELERAAPPRGLLRWLHEPRHLRSLRG